MEDEVVRRFASGEGTLWVDLDVSAPAQAALLKDVFNFHPLAIEDALNPNSSVKVDEYPTFLTIVARVVSFVDSTPDPYDLETANLTIFITKNAIVTAHLQNLPIIQTLVATLKGNPDLLDRGPARIAHFVLDGAVDVHFPVLDRLDEFVDEIEQREFGRFDEQLLQEIFKVKRLVISLRRFLAPQREVLSQLTMRPSPLLPSETQLYFRDVAGVYGMNFDHIPLAHHPYGFEIMVVVQAVLAVLFLLALRYRKMV